MEVFTTPDAMRAWSRSRRRDGAAVAFVPTMGALHDGHHELVRRAAAHGDVVVSIFVNPLQFNRSDDFDAYPRPITADLESCRELGAAAAYAPTAATMYPPGFQTTVVPGALADPLEGAGRPGHFAGVTTVVSKLFHAVEPDVAVFGQKDYQQLAVVRRMTRDLDMGIEIVGVPTVREADGLARSSRNQLLAPEDRRAAPCVPTALGTIRAAFAAGERDGAALAAAARAVVAAEPRARLEYVEVVDATELTPVARVINPVVVVIAVWFGSVRLIDNLVLDPSTDDAPPGRRSAADVS